MDDAKLGAEILEIVLTCRPRGKDGEIPMAGIPYHAADAYIARLVKNGYKVAICEQVSEPSAKGIVDREVVRIVTPGTLLDEKTLNKKEHNFSLSLSFSNKKIGLAIADLSTGDFLVTELDKTENNESLINELSRLSASECIVSEDTYNNPELLKILNGQQHLNIYPFLSWDKWAGNAETVLKKNFEVNNLEVFGLDEKKEAVEATASLLGYLEETQKAKIKHIKNILFYSPADSLILDRSTINNLELFNTLRDRDDKGSVIEVIDKTITAMGGRLLREWLRKPLKNKNEIEARLSGIDELLKQRESAEAVRANLKHINDIPRLLSRLSVGIGNAYDLKNLEKSLKHAVEIKNIISGFKSELLDTENIFSSDVLDIISLIEENINDNPPIDTKSGGIIKAGINDELDELRVQVLGGKDWIARMELEEREKTGINSLKIKFNKVFGYYIEVTNSNLNSVPENYQRKQTMINGERFITPELKEYEKKVLLGEELMHRMEHEMFIDIVCKILIHTELLQAVAYSIAMIDCLSALSELALSENYTKPEISTDGEIDIKDGRHPIVERNSPDHFTPNDTLLNNRDNQLLVITGPNMAGKSVFMRQVAVITLLAHIGSFVPASKAKISLVDRIFVRSGASDFIASGLSTFMVEMVETAHILNQATDQSLIIMDEIGRGTSTYDGISIAWAVAEQLVKKTGAKTLFATHYHELQMLEENFPEHIKNYEVLVEEKESGEPVFLHKVEQGKASHSYAVAVAKLAGVPSEVNERAIEILADLEKRSSLGNEKANLKMDFEYKKTVHNNCTVEDGPKNNVKQALRDIQLDSMTPLEALNKLAELRKKALEDY